MTIISSKNAWQKYQHVVLFITCPYEDNELTSYKRFTTHHTFNLLAFYHHSTDDWKKGAAIDEVV